MRFLIDQPVSNSGRLAAMLRDAATANAWPWTAETVPNPDPVLAVSAAIVASSDAWILDRCRAWTNVVRPRLPADAWLVDLAGPA